MHLIRPARADDLDLLYKLAKMVFFINLPAEKEIIEEKIRRSRASFEAAATGRVPRVAPDGKGAVKDSPLFMFVIEDTETGNCLGTSMIVARMGTKGHPNLSFQLRRKEFFSRDLQEGHTHTTAKLWLDESSPSEIGGLILSPSVRRHPQKLGKQISLSRFHYIGMHRKLFSDRVIAEMMAPLTGDGRSPFWEALGRRFINLSYRDADMFCQHSREFMLSLLPREEIYLSLLPPEARQVIGQVGPDTAPARRMLESIGFKYLDRVDPFDGGPHLEADTDTVSLVRDTNDVEYGGVCNVKDATAPGFVSAETEDGDLRLCYARVAAAGNGRSVRLTKDVADLLRAEDAKLVSFTPVDLGADRKPQAPPVAEPKAAPKKHRRSAAKS
ncbi:MAG TPA: arginine N-succinyltransferase [Phycisphaerales bacterium]|nr:arginine N-succinyltransferase [Phycisphaerales bacterium]